MCRVLSNSGYGRGIEVQNGAILTAEGVLIDGNTELGLLAQKPGTQVILVDTIVRNTGGRGIEVDDGATLLADGCLVDGNTAIGLLASLLATHVTLRDTAISGTKSATDMRASAASGATVQQGASMFASHFVATSNQGSGILVNGGGAMVECVGCYLEGNQFAGAATVNGGTLTITDSTIEGTTPGINLLGGAGVYAWPWGGDPPTVTLTNTLIQNNPIAGVWLIGDGTYVLTGNTISGGIGEAFGSGSRCGDAVLARDGVTAWNGTTGLFLQDNTFQDASGSGVFLDGSAAFLDGNSYSGNVVDLVVQNQSCDPIPAWYSEAPQPDFCPFYSYPTCYAEFFFVAVPADPVDWEEDKAAPRPKLEPIHSITRPARPHPIIPITLPGHPSHHPSLSR